MERRMKLLLATSIVGMFGSVVGGRLLAQASPSTAPWSEFTQFGLGGLFAALLFWCIAKTIPQLAAEHKEAAIALAREHKEAAAILADVTAKANERLGDKIDGLGSTFTTGMDGVKDEVKNGNDAQLNLLRQNVQTLHKIAKNEGGGSGIHA